MVIATKNSVQGMLIIRMSDNDFLDRNVSNQIQTKLAFVVESAQINRLLINLEEVTFLSSESIGQLIMLKKKCDQKMIALALCCISSKNLAVLQLVRCDEIIDLYGSQQEAVVALSDSFMLTPSAPLSADEVEQLQAQAEAGDVETMYQLARRKNDGDGVPHDPEGAVVLFTKAAKLNHRESQFELATCYAFGLGVQQDYAKAIPWYKKAADQGHADAQYMIGMSYHYALNDVTDLQVAKSWYVLAAVQGHEKATLVLETLDS